MLTIKAISLDVSELQERASLKLVLFLMIIMQLLNKLLILQKN
ncbi:hypothetical protein [Spiroplasma endosymbiont of Polydrusus cervinus]